MVSWSQDSESIDGDATPIPLWPWAIHLTSVPQLPKGEAHVPC